MTIRRYVLVVTLDEPSIVAYGEKAPHRGLDGGSCGRRADRPGGAAAWPAVPRLEPDEGRCYKADLELGGIRISSGHHGRTGQRNSANWP